MKRIIQSATMVVLLVYQTRTVKECRHHDYLAMMYHVGFSLIVGYFLVKIVLLLKDLRWPFQSNKGGYGPFFMNMMVIVSCCLAFIHYKYAKTMTQAGGYLEDLYGNSAKGLKSFDNTWLTEPATDGECSNSPYKHYNINDSASIGALIMACFAVVMSFTKYYIHSVALVYCSWTTLLLAIHMEHSQAPNDTLYQYGRNAIGLCWVSDLQDGKNLPMWVSFYAPTTMMITLAIAAVIFAKLVMGQVKGRAFTEAKLVYLHCVTFDLLGEASVLATMIFAFFLAHYEVPDHEVTSAILVAADFIIWAFLTAYADLRPWWTDRTAEDDVNVQLRVNLFTQLLKQMQKEKAGEIPNSEQMPSLEDMDKFANLRQFWGMSEDFDEIFDDLYQMSQCMQDIDNHHLYTETVDHGGASGAARAVGYQMRLRCTGSIMFFLQNSDKYIVKTITAEEAGFFLKSILPDYLSLMIHGRCAPHCVFHIVNTGCLLCAVCHASG